MTTQLPIVSLIIRTKDRPNFLRNALESVAIQSYTNIEVILINDGGCDLDITHLEKLLYPVSLCYIKNETSKGRSFAANIALNNITGQYVGFLDDDDILLPEHLMILTSFLNKSDYLIAYTNVEEYQKKFDLKTQSYQSELINTYSKDFNATELLFYNYIPFNGLLFNASVLKNERLDISLDIYEDWELLIRLSRKYAFYHIDIVSAHYNKWSNDLQINNLNYAKTMFANQAAIIERYMNYIPADFLRQLWSERLSSLSSNDNCQYELNKLHALLDEYLHINGECKRKMDRMKTYQLELNAHQFLLFEEEKQVLNNQHTIKLNNLMQQMKHLSDELAYKTSTIQQLESNISRINNEINTIHISLSWRLIKRIRTPLVLLFPHDSLRQKLYLSIRHGAGQFIRLFITKKK